MTAPFLSYQAWAMRPDYRADYEASPDYSLAWTPVDFGAIDAPLHMPAGGVYSFKSWATGTSFPLGISARREA